VESKLQSEIHKILGEINSLEKVQRHLDDINAQIKESTVQLAKLDKKIDVKIQ